MLIEGDFPTSLDFLEMVKHPKIPCRCVIGRQFTISFDQVIKGVAGLVRDWDLKEIGLRSPAGGGGKYIHDSAGLVSLKAIPAGYFIEHLEIFTSYTGWSIIITDGEYGPVGNFWDSDLG